MSQLKKHDELPVDMTWDLTPLYTDSGAWEKDFSSLDPLADAFSKFKGRLSESPETLLGAFEAEDALELVAERLYAFAHLKSDEDASNADNRARLDRVSEKYASLAGQTSWFTPELVALEQTVFNSYLTSPLLSEYRRALDEVARFRAHILSEAEERILNLSSNAYGMPGKAFSAFNDADLKFPAIKDENGNDVEVTKGNYMTLIRSSARSVRRDAFFALGNAYASHRNTLAALLNGNVRNNILRARLRSFPSALEASLYSDNVPASVYDGLIETVRGKISYMHGYIRFRARTMNLPKLDMYDFYNPLIPSCSIEISWSEAVEKVLASLRPLGDEYCGIAGKAFPDRWIDALECRGKRAGAYSGGCYRKPPYILMSFQRDLGSVFTLAHELGHSMHTWFSDHALSRRNAGYRIFVAEVVSVTNEMLLHAHLMKTAADPSVRAYLLNQLVDEARGTLYRQTMFAEFEREIHKLAENGTPLTADLLSDIYYNLNSFYYGDGVEADKLISMEWARIPHFYSSFYVYKYATGFAAAVALSRNILAGETAPYMRFLKAGNTKDVLDILKDAGVDLTVPAPVESALDFFNLTVNQLEKDLREL